MTGAERARAVSYLRETKAQVLHEVSAWSAEQWRFKPSPSSWCACECIGHITLAEEGLLRRVQAMIHEPEAPADVLAQAAGRDELIVRMIRSRKRKVQAPAAHSLLDASTPEASVILGRFDRARDLSIEYLETTTDPIRTRVHPHFILGPFDGYQWMLFLGAHAKRHLQQIQEVKDHPEFPR